MNDYKLTLSVTKLRANVMFVNNKNEKVSDERIINTKFIDLDLDYSEFDIGKDIERCDTNPNLYIISGLSNLEITINETYILKIEIADEKVSVGLISETIICRLKRIIKEIENYYFSIVTLEQTTSFKV